MKNLGKKRGVSPAVASSLLVVLAIILALIIFLWAKTFQSESVMKQGTEVDNLCSQLQFQAEVITSDGTLGIVNSGNLPIYGVVLRKKGLFGTSDIGSNNGVVTQGGQLVLPGESNSVPIPGFSSSGVSAGDTIIVTPILLGEDDSGIKKAKVCSTGEIEIEAS
ncbi:hypothetical protein D6817_05180 [Candidatus Pacearchaeota archaeon]|nr:MAG: hypothetical protein D6817_05180 [Candidatus Pacearchaeota archaeon]